MDTLTEIVCKADLLFGLRPILEKFGFSQSENLVVAFKYQDRVVKTEPIPPISHCKSSTFNSQDLNAAVLDWLNKAEMQYELSKVFGKELGLPDESDSDITVRFIAKSNTLVFSNMTVCCPCFPNAGFCCFKQAN